MKLYGITCDTCGKPADGPHCEVGSRCAACHEVQFQVVSSMKLYTVTGRFMYGLMIVRATSPEEGLKIARVTDRGTSINIWNPVCNHSHCSIGLI